MGIIVKEKNEAIMPFVKGHKLAKWRPKGSKNRNNNSVNVSFAKDLVKDLIGTFKSGRYYV